MKKKSAPEPMVKRIFKTQAAWHAWLEKNHEDPGGIWLHFAKKGSDLATLTYDQALETALCFGWIDGQLRTHDAKSFVRKFTPRRARSVWSRINRTKAEKLIESGRMKAPGLQAIERAREGGEWDRAYDSGRTATTPADFKAALDKNKRAAAFFRKLDAANRYAMIWRVQTARNDKIRASRIAALVKMLEEGKTFHPWTFK